MIKQKVLQLACKQVRYGFTKISYYQVAKYTHLISSEMMERITVAIMPHKPIYSNRTVGSGLKLGPLDHPDHILSK